ncbi:MAG: GC-type dockerin domain-anchored protein [Phycisphaerales bacterium]
MAFSTVMLLALAAGRASPDVSALPYPSPGGAGTIADLYLRPEVPAGNIGGVGGSLGGTLTSLPTIILLHGGGYCCGDRTELNIIAERLKTHGFNVLNANYTLSVVGTSYAYPQAIRDVKSLIAWVRTDGAAFFNLNPQVVVVGNSAGATIGFTASFVQDDPLFDPPGDPPPGGYAVQMVCGLSGRSNMPWDFDVGNNVGNVINYFGGWMNQAQGGFLSRPYFERGSALYRVTPSCPPTAVYHSRYDTIVPFGHSQQLVNQLVANQVPVVARFPSNAAHAHTMFGEIYWAADMIASDVCNLLNVSIPGFVPTPPPVITPPPPPPPPPPAPRPRPPAGPGGLADVAHTGGQLGPDGIVTVDDLVAYLSAFFSGNLAVADLCGPGGVNNLDDDLSADDLICFLGAFFQAP